MNPLRIVHKLPTEGDPWLGALTGRQQIADSLTKLINNSASQSVIAIEAGWGRGKTTFLMRWKASLNINEPKQFCFYFNAWENDFAEDPLVALIAELKSQFLEQLIADDTDKDAQRIVEKMKDIGAKVIRLSIPVGIKILSAGAINAADLNFDGEKIGDAAKDWAKQKIEGYEAAQKTLQGFRDTLTEYTSLLSTKQGGKQVIFIIDELDRCRPTYAVSLLERLKHLFSVPGLTFVLAIDKAQLASAVRSLYGAQFDSVGYLKRFIDLEYRLPDPNVGDFLSASADLVKLKELCGDQVSFGDLHNSLRFLVTLFGLGLRDIEQLIVRYSLVMRASTGIDKFVLVTLVPFIVACQQSGYAELFEAITSRAIGPDDAFARITNEIPKAHKNLESREGGMLMGALHICLAQSDDQLRKFVAEHATRMSKLNVRTTGVEPPQTAYFDGIDDALRWTRNHNYLSQHGMNDVRKLVEFVDGFKT